MEWVKEDAENIGGMVIREKELSYGSTGLCIGASYTN